MLFVYRHVWRNSSDKINSLFFNVDEGVSSSVVGQQLFVWGGSVIQFNSFIADSHKYK